MCSSRFSTDTIWEWGFPKVECLSLSALSEMGSPHLVTGTVLLAGCLVVKHQKHGLTKNLGEQENEIFPPYHPTRTFHCAALLLIVALLRSIQSSKLHSPFQIGVPISIQDVHHGWQQQEKCTLMQERGRITF